MSDPLLVIDNLSAHYGQAKVLDGISFSIDRGQLVSIVGANGAGKTTLIRTIAGMVKPTGGRVAFNGNDLAGRSSATICEYGIAQVAEGRQIFPSLTVAENLMLGGGLKRSRSQRNQTVEEVYELFPRLAERRAQRAGTLSGGEQQMLAIGRCLMAKPDLIMFDEPSLGLAPTLVITMFDIIRRLNEDGMTILLVEQNVMESLDLCSVGHVLENGEIVLSGTAEELKNNDEVRQAYLGL